MDVDRDPELLERYGEHVPVLLVAGVEVFRHRADASALRQRLREVYGAVGQSAGAAPRRREPRGPETREAPCR